MARICLCLTGKTLARNLEILEKYRRYIDMAELRADCLEPDERFLIRRFPEQAGLPVILTIRRKIDGGLFVGGEGSRINILAKGLAFAEADRRRNFAYVDLEEDLNVPSLEEAARTFGTRIIRSCHNMNGVFEDIPGRVRRLLHAGDEIAKVAVKPQSSAGVLAVYRAAKETKGVEKILVCMGHLGTNTRILAEYIGSFLTYTSPTEEPDMPLGAEGQISPKELVNQYRFRNVQAGTKILGIVGYPLQVTSSPAFFNAVFTQENTNAVYVPFPADSLDSFMRLAEEISITGASVTIPYKEKVFSYLQNRTEEVTSLGACNTIIAGSQGWFGVNTDTRGFSDSLLDFTGLRDFRGKRVTIIGAGGAARAAAAEVYRLKGKALVLNRAVVRAKELARRYRFVWGCLDAQGAELMNGFKDIIIQTTSVGMEPHTNEDPMELYSFKGTEVAMDMIYKPERTKFLIRAAAAGCRILNGYDMLIRQAKYQYFHFMGKEFPSKLISRE
jgi:3-dehydroquinate dehydratase/shikimate dehydrogenase